MRPIPRRFWIPLAVTWLATATALVLATVQRGEYNPNLAILTLTLIAVIWYTYFTYRSVHREPTGYVLTQLSYDPMQELLSPSVRNPTERTLDVRLVLDIWVDRVTVTTDDFYSGRESKRLGPTQGFNGVVDLKPYNKIQRDQHSRPVSGANEVLIRMTASWTDDLGDQQGGLPIYKRIEPQQGRHQDLIAPSEIQRHFGGLPGF